jgi:hypothetical protein
MRAKDIVPGFQINVPVTINIPWDAVTPTSDDAVINPGVRYGTNQKAMWSPPLQQHLDTMKDGVGTTMPDVVNQPQTSQSVQADNPPVTLTASLKPKHMGLFAQKPSMPG